MAPHIALHEVGAAFTPRQVSLRRRENRSAEFLALNPEGKVPLLLTEGGPLTEVAAILFWLARRHPQAGLLPMGDALAEAQVISWMSFLAATVHPARRQGVDHALQVWSLAEGRLGGAPYALGATCSVADIHLFRLFWRFKGSAALEPGAFPRLTAHHDRMMARPAVRRVLRDEAAMGYELPA
ncbi:glutathione S-transferase family protein [Sediminicoccus sp. KRV36]|uniref:glutathione S-transferase family protein n=1 Tax=Sediminicoccus sp. KRV36 TaxID=3133721 RepID=UPI0020104CE6|nr:glutathione S-transferase family protein [Sediminicoccus rosea]